MRFVLLLILIGCSQHSNSRLVTGKSGGGAKPPDCSTPSPLCLDMKKDEDSEKEEDEEEESGKQPSPGSAGSSQAQMPPAPTDYFGGLDNKFKLNVSRASIPNNQEVELTLTVSAVVDLKMRSKNNAGVQLTYDLLIKAQKATSTSKMPDTYKLDKTSTNDYFGGKVQRCDINGRNAAWTQCILKIRQMDKDDSFTVTMKVKASEDFNIGFAKKCADEECKEKEPLTIKVN